MYQLGQPIKLTFTETNTGSQPESVRIGPNAFEVKQNGTEVWNSTNSSSTSASQSWETLQPGLSYSQSVTWNGPVQLAPTESQTSATFVASDLLDPDNSSASFTIVAPTDPTSPVQNPVTPIADPAPPVRIP